MVTGNGTIYKCEATWDQVMSGQLPTNPARQVWRQAVDDVAAKAKAVLTESHGRIDQAVKLVLAGDVTLHPDGTATVGSQTQGQQAYHVNGECACKDFAKAPANFCKHRLAFGLAKRATRLTAERLRQAEAGIADVSSPAPQAALPAVTPQNAGGLPTRPLPEAPASVNVHLDLDGRRVQLTLRDQDETHLLARLKAVLVQFPVAAAAEPPRRRRPPSRPPAAITARRR
jgi:hypothetical protein